LGVFGDFGMPKLVRLGICNLREENFMRELEEEFCLECYLTKIGFNQENKIYRCLNCGNSWFYPNKNHMEYMEYYLDKMTPEFLDSLSYPEIKPGGMEPDGN
jgi:hypothetical protein